MAGGRHERVVAGEHHSGRMVVTRSCKTAAPQSWQALNATWVPGFGIMVDDQGQLECSSVTSFQCRCLAMALSASNHSPAAESPPTRATVSTGWTVSPNTHSWGLLTGMSSRQPAVRYSDWLILSVAAAPAAPRRARPRPRAPRAQITPSEFPVKGGRLATEVDGGQGDPHDDGERPPDSTAAGSGPRTTPAAPCPPRAPSSARRWSSTATAMSTGPVTSPGCLRQSLYRLMIG